MNTEKRKMILCAFIIACLGVLLSLPYLAGAGDLEPPSIAVDGIGNPVSTTMTPPSWSKKLPASERFELVLDGEAVLDKETGLVWEQSPSVIQMPWISAFVGCLGLDAGDRKGWRLPTIEELTSLIDPTESHPSLPSGWDSYFSNLYVQVDDYYWSSSTYSAEPDNHQAWVVHFNIDPGIVNHLVQSSVNRAWCVRGGHGHDTYHVTF